MGRDMKVNGVMICNTVRERRHGLMGRCMKGSTSQERNTGSVSTAGTMAQDTKEIGSRTRSGGLAPIPG